MIINLLFINRHSLIKNISRVKRNIAFIVLIVENISFSSCPEQQLAVFTSTEQPWLFWMKFYRLNPFHTSD